MKRIALLIGAETLSVKVRSSKEHIPFPGKFVDRTAPEKDTWRRYSVSEFCLHFTMKSLRTGRSVFVGQKKLAFIATRFHLKKFQI